MECPGHRRAQQDFPRRIFLPGRFQPRLSPARERGAAEDARSARNIVPDIFLMRELSTPSLLLHLQAAVTVKTDGEVARESCRGSWVIVRCERYMRRNLNGPPARYESRAGVS